MDPQLGFKPFWAHTEDKYLRKVDRNLYPHVTKALPKGSRSTLRVVSVNLTQ